MPGRLVHQGQLDQNWKMNHQSGQHQRVCLSTFQKSKNWVSKRVYHLTKESYQKCSVGPASPHQNTKNLVQNLKSRLKLMVAFGFRLHWLEHLALFLLARLDPMVNPAGYASSLIVVENNAASNRRRHLRNAPPYPWAPGATATDSNHLWISCGRYVRQPKDKSAADALGLDSASQSCPRLQQPFANCQTAKLQRNQNGLSTLLFEIEPLELSGWGLELCRTHVWRHHWNEARNMYVLNHTSKQYSANTRCEYTAIYI